MQHTIKGGDPHHSRAAASSVRLSQHSVKAVDNMDATGTETVAAFYEANVDPSAWPRALQRLAGDSTLRLRLGQAGRETVIRDYSMSGWASRLAETYRQAVAR